METSLRTDEISEAVGNAAAARDPLASLTEFSPTERSVVLCETSEGGSEPRSMACSFTVSGGKHLQEQTKRGESSCQPANNGESEEVVASTVLGRMSQHLVN